MFRQWEMFFVFPGSALLKTIEERIAANHAIGTAGLAQRISAALLTHPYRTRIWRLGKRRTVGEHHRPITRDARKCAVGQRHNHFRYTVAFGHILLTTWGTIIVYLMT